MAKARGTPRKKLIKFSASYSKILKNPGRYSYKEIEKIWREIEKARGEELDAVWIDYFKVQNPTRKKT
jgi:hypothetical protein